MGKGLGEESAFSDIDDWEASLLHTLHLRAFLNCLCYLLTISLGSSRKGRDRNREGRREAYHAPLAFSSHPSGCPCFTH